MWIALNDGFISVVQADMQRLPKAERMHRRTGDFLCVRARKAAHLAALFPHHRIYRFRNRDYPARIFIDKADFSKWLVKRAEAIDYGNFKNSVQDYELHDAYMGVWSVMNRYGNGGFRQRWREGFDRQDDFWRGRWPESEARRDVARLDNPDGVCGLLGCTADNPCRDCISQTLDRVCGECRYPYDDVGHNPDCSRYGDFDDQDDEGAQSHLRVPPK